MHVRVLHQIAMGWVIETKMVAMTLQPFQTPCRPHVPQLRHKSSLRFWNLVRDMLLVVKDLTIVLSQDKAYIHVVC